MRNSPTLWKEEQDCCLCRFLVTNHFWYQGELEVGGGRQEHMPKGLIIIQKQWNIAVIYTVFFTSTAISIVTYYTIDKMKTAPLVTTGLPLMNDSFQ